MLLMVEKGIRGGICQATLWYVKANNKYMKNYDKNKQSSYLNYWDVNYLYGWELSQKCPAYGFEWVEDAFQFNEDFINISNEDSDIGYFIEAHVHYPEKLHEPHNVYPFYLQQ